MDITCNSVCMGRVCVCFVCNFALSASLVNIAIVFSSCSCDCFILKDILQNWSDEDAALILNNLFTVVNRGNRVLIIETVLHTGSFSDERVSLHSMLLT